MTGEILNKNNFPENFKEVLITRHNIIKTIREFFNNFEYIEVETPIRVLCPGVEPYIDAIPAGSDHFLTPSPELHMKRLMTVEIPRIYQITHAFRAHEAGQLHNPEFTLLEWYRTNTDYLGVMEETEQLIKNVCEALNINTHNKLFIDFPLQRITVDEVFNICAGWEPSKDWDEDIYFNDWVDKIEPYILSLGGLFLFDFPAPLASLAKLKKTNPKVCERFELFLNGLEVANAFTELTDPVEQEHRFINASIKRKQMGKDAYSVDTSFLDALKAGIPDCAGVALGIDRLIMALLDIHDINSVQTFPTCRL
jgi:lysyl-tRNA synthetase class 2